MFLSALFAIAFASGTSLASPLAATQQGAYFVDCTITKTGEKSSQMWLLDDIKKPDFEKAVVAVISNKEYFNFKSDHEFNDLHFFFGKGSLNSMATHLEVSGVFSIDSQGQKSPRLVRRDGKAYVGYEVSILAASADETFRNGLSGQLCTGTYSGPISFVWRVV